MRLDAAPFAAVLFLVVMFLLLASLTYTPGVRLELPQAKDLPGSDRPPIRVAIDSAGRLYYENQFIEEKLLKVRFQAAVQSSREPLTLIVQADKSVNVDKLIRLSMLARDAGIQDALIATLPRPTP